MILQTIINVVELCALKGVTRAIISPGSRSAPLTLAFARHPKIKTYVIPDERSAGFIAMGMSQKLSEPVAIICTSGSAVYNYAPSVAEAYYSNTSLIVFSADRPPEWVDQRDGQTIRQKGIFGDHIKGSFELPDTISEHDTEWHTHRIINDAINLACGKDSGPVHINVPMREPFYPEGDFPTPTKDLKVFKKVEGVSTFSETELDKIKESLKRHKRILIVAGQSDLDHEQLKNLNTFTVNNNIPVITDVISNFGSLENSILHQDLLLDAVKESDKADLRPGLLITFGKSVISKNLKLFLRKYTPQEHWHIGEIELVADTFQSLTSVLDQSINDFCHSFDSTESHQPIEYLNNWKNLDAQTHQVLDNLETQEFWELPIVAQLLKELPQNTQLHLANSMPIRWANFVNHRRDDVEVFANRGTSGIDGCLSTAVGCALACNEPVIAILGDMAFFYDRNGLWHNHYPPNLRILVINNHGGGIFRLINGPSQQPELEEYFETRQKLSIRNTVNDFDIDYLEAENFTEYNRVINSFLLPNNKPKVLEVHVDSKTNKGNFELLKRTLSNHLNK